MSIRLSVIVPCHNAVETVGEQLEALAGQEWSERWEVIISDNGASEGLGAVVDRYRESLPAISVVDSSDRRGPGYARNVGARAAKGDAFLFCDADDQVAPGWLAAMGDALSKFDFVTSRLDFEKLNPPRVARTFRHHPQRQELQRVRYPPYLARSGASGLGVKRALHEVVRGFDESLRANEDTDYCFRIQLLGTDLQFVPDALIHIRARESLGTAFHQARIWAETNVLLYKRYGLRDTKPSSSWKRYAGNWGQLVRHLSEIRSASTRHRWVWSLGWQVGLMQGSLRYFAPPT
ncbi:MAG: glycosyltransferase family 2 protein [Chloroflexi bacterium]|nr:glycosyltransferase family 2 protein [Chloroflexota bacterium]